MGRPGRAVPDDEAVFGGPGFQGMRDVVVGGPGFVAVGRDSSIVGPDTYAVAAVWTSPDGINWSRVAHDDAVFGRATGEPDDIFRMTAVTTGGPGLVAIGERGGESDHVERSGGLDRGSRRGRGVDVDRRDHLVTRSARPCRLRPLAHDLASERAGRLGALGVDAGHHARRTRAGGGG